MCVLKVFIDLLGSQKADKLRGRLVRRMISEGMESVKGIGIWKELE